MIPERQTQAIGSVCSRTLLRAHENRWRQGSARASNACQRKSTEVFSLSLSLARRTAENRTNLDSYHFDLDKAGSCRRSVLLHVRWPRSLRLFGRPVLRRAFCGFKKRGTIVLVNWIYFKSSKSFSFKSYSSKIYF